MLIIESARMDIGSKIATKSTSTKQLFVKFSEESFRNQHLF